MISYMTLIVKLFQAKDLPALDEDAANVFAKSERILLDHATKRFKNASELKTIFKRVMQYLNNLDYTSSNSTRTINGLDDLSKDELIQKIIKLRSKRKDGRLIPSGYFDLSVPLLTGIEHYEGGGYSKKKKGRFRTRV